jgi:PAS domain S-box-containing protein
LSSTTKPELETLLESAEEMGHMGSWDWDLETDELRWSDNLFRIFGLEPGLIVPSPEYVLLRTHPEDRGRVEHELSSARGEVRLRPLEYRMVLPDGEIRHLRTAQALVEEVDGRPRRLVGSVQDITDQRQTERQIAAHLAVAEALAEWQSFEKGASGLLTKVAGGLDADAGVLWLAGGDVLVPEVIWSSGGVDVSEFESVVGQLRLPREVGLAGQAWAAAEPMTAASLGDDPRFPTEAVGELRSVVALPATHGEEVLAVLEFYFRDTGRADTTGRLERSLAGIGSEIGRFLASRRGELRAPALTPRELEVLQLASYGFTGPEIAGRLVVSQATVKTHFENIYEKYGVSDRAAAVAKALRDGLIE